jgi:hypothetical protein
LYLYLSDCENIVLLSPQERKGPPSYTSLILFPGDQQ